MTLTYSVKDAGNTQVPTSQTTLGIRLSTPIISFPFFTAVSQPHQFRQFQPMPGMRNALPISNFASVDDSNAQRFGNSRPRKLGQKWLNPGHVAFICEPCRLIRWVPRPKCFILAFAGCTPERHRFRAPGSNTPRLCSLDQSCRADCHGTSLAVGPAL